MKVKKKYISKSSRNRTRYGCFRNYIPNPSPLDSAKFSRSIVGRFAIVTGVVAKFFWAIVTSLRNHSSKYHVLLLWVPHAAWEAYPCFFSRGLGEKSTRHRTADTDLFLTDGVPRFVDLFPTSVFGWYHKPRRATLADAAWRPSFFNTAEFG